MAVRESKARSIAKSIVWRVIATVNGWAVAFAFLHDFNTSVKVSVVANITGMIMYYIHERVWNRIDWKRE
jgi:uncharacterized membrane protein